MNPIDPTTAQHIRELQDRVTTLSSELQLLKDELRGFIKKLGRFSRSDLGIKRVSRPRKVLIDGQLFPSVNAAAAFLTVHQNEVSRIVHRGGNYRGHLVQYADEVKP